jgi:FtsP/CotA-like multicopper oxidase with cupredoxin domain
MNSRHLVDRRGFIRATGGAVGGAGLVCLIGAREGLAARPAPVTRYPLHIPPVVSPSGLTLTAAPSVEDLGGGSLSNAWTYNSELPGPTIAASSGDTASIGLVNGLPEETITHWHGMLVDDVNDGHPRFAIPPGGSYDYNFTIQNRACLNWYHPHPHMLTGKQVNLGLAGAFIVRDPEETALGLPSGAYEIPLIIRDATRDKAGNLQYQPRSGGFDGKIPLVNGTRSPYLTVDKALYRFRILNGANARIFRLALGNGAVFTLIGNDGGLLETAASLAQIDVAPAERLDLIVDFRGASAGDPILLRDLRSGWDLLEFRVSSTSVAGGPIPTTLSTIDALSVADVQTVRDFSFDGMSKINGREYDMERVDFQVPFDQTELWRFHTNGNAPHPVHVHGASFQVISRSGGRGALFPWEAGWKDTVLLEDGESVEVLLRFTAHRGLYLMHCHKLEHEDMGMMSNFEVI